MPLSEIELRALLKEIGAVGQKVEHALTIGRELKDEFKERFAEAGEQRGKLERKVDEVIGQNNDLLQQNAGLINQFMPRLSHFDQRLGGAESGLKGVADRVGVLEKWRADVEAIQTVVCGCAD